MVNAASVEARIVQILTTALHLDVPSVETDLFETGAVDSLGFVEFLLHLEREFGIKVALDDLEIDHFRTIQRIVRFVLNQDGRVVSAAARNGDHSPGQP